eukprot:10367832-Karenia_brevis.AAC.1
MRMLLRHAGVTHNITTIATKSNASKIFMKMLAEIHIVNLESINDTFNNAVTMHDTTKGNGTTMNMTPDGWVSDTRVGKTDLIRSPITFMVMIKGPLRIFML